MQAKSKKKNNGLLVLASARGYLGDVRDLAQQVLSCLLMHTKLVLAQLPLAQERLRMHSVQSVRLVQDCSARQQSAQELSSIVSLCTCPAVSMTGIARFMHALQVQQLLEMGADADAKDKRGISALHYASGQGRLEVLQFLWSRGLDLDADDPGIAFSKLSVIQPTHGPLFHGMHI